VVVRSAPLLRLGSVLSEEADVSGYAGCMCSCIAVVEWLKKQGVLTHPEVQKATDYLRLHERPWPQESPIQEGTELLLDGLSVTYLQSAGVLAKLRPARLIASISQSHDQEATALLEMARFGSQQLEVIEQIRSVLSAGLASGRVRTARVARVAGQPAVFPGHPTYGTLALSADVDAIVVDDRFVNRHMALTQGSHSCAVLSSLDVLSLLHAAGTLSLQEIFQQRTVLRQCGYQLIPVLDDELLHYLREAPVLWGKLVETAELRAIRESLLRARMGAIVQLPGEIAFLHGSLGSCVRAIGEIWETTLDSTEAIARSDYVLEWMDVRKWASSAIVGTERGFAINGFASYAVLLSVPPPKADKRQRVAYFEWITERLLGPIQQYQPEMYEWILARSREVVVARAEKSASDYLSAKGGGSQL
jgi:hypothetical protein